MAKLDEGKVARIETVSGKLVARLVGFLKKTLEKDELAKGTILARHTIDLALMGKKKATKKVARKTAKKAKPARKPRAKREVEDEDEIED